MVSSDMSSRIPRIILLGKVGVGKSYLCKVLGASAKTHRGGTHGTVNWQDYELQLKGTRYILVDTPGMFDWEAAVTERNLQRINEAFEAGGASKLIYIAELNNAGRILNDDREGMSMMMKAVPDNRESDVEIWVNVVAATSEEEAQNWYVGALAVYSHLGGKFSECKYRQYIKSDGTGIHEQAMMLDVLQSVHDRYGKAQPLERLSNEEKRQLRDMINVVEEKLRKQELEHTQSIRAERERYEKTVKDLDKRYVDERQRQLVVTNAVMQQLEVIRVKIVALIGHRRDANGASVIGMVGALFTFGATLGISGIAAAKTYDYNKQIMSYIREADRIYGENRNVPGATQLINAIKQLKPNALFNN